MELISREQAIDAVMECYDNDELFEAYEQKLNELPTIQPEPQEIGYDDCANALLKMWMDNVLTDGEYYRIAGKLNYKWGKTELPEPYKGVTNGRD